MSASSSEHTATAAPTVEGNHVQLAAGAVAKIRSPIWVVVFTIITLGIYQVFWWYFVNREMADYGRAKGTKALGDNPTKSTLALFPGGLIVVPAIWTFFTTFQRIQASQRLNGQIPINGWLGVVIFLVISPVLIGYMQSGLNSAWKSVETAVRRPPPEAPVAVAARIKDKHLPSRVAGKRSPSLVGAIEGTIIATAVVVGLDEADSVTPLRGFWILVATGTFFWIAHVYADLLADRIKGHHRMGRHAIVSVMAREWPLLQSSFVLAIPLALGAIGVLSTQVAYDLAWLGGVAALVGWGIVFSRKEGHGFTGIVAAAALNAAVGLLIVGFKVIVK